jgi:hypothetical protein
MTVTTIDPDGMAQVSLVCREPFVVIHLIPSHFGGNVSGASMPAPRS